VFNDDRQLVEEYEINPYTMIIFPYQYGSKTFSKVVEFEEEYTSPFKPIDLIKRSCEYFFADFEGRKKGTRMLTGITHKAPIAIDPLSSIFFLPTTSPTNSGCIWVSHEHVLHHKKYDSYSTRVTFRNNQSFILPVSFNSFENQLLRTALLRTRMMQRMKETERRAGYLFHSPRFTDGAGLVSENNRYED
jgi:competence protein ComK